MTEDKRKDKRQTPAALQRLLNIDKALTKSFCSAVEKHLPYPQYRKHYKLLEYSCHALTWFFGTFAALWLLWNDDLFQTQVNLLFGLTIDCVICAISKAAIRRRRPSSNTNDMFLTVGIDAYSFPSGHVSRAFMIAYMSAFITHSNFLIVVATLVWAVAICISRILLKRHHILDAVGGILFGLAEGWLLSIFWLGKETSVWLVQYLSEEAVNLEGLQDDQMVD